MKPTPAQERFLRSLLEGYVVCLNSRMIIHLENLGLITSETSILGRIKCTITDLGRKAIGAE